MALERKFQKGYVQLAKPFFVEAGASKYLFIGWCEDVNKVWKDKNIVIKMTGMYNGIYTIEEELVMTMFLDKTFMEVKGDLETAMWYIKKGLVVQNDSYMPIQKSLDAIAKSACNLKHH